METDPTNTTYKTNLSQVKQVLQTDFEFTDVYQDIQLKRWEKAVNKLESILLGKPRNTKAKELLALCCNNWAIEYMDAANGYIKQGDIYNATESYEQAEKLLQKAVEKLIDEWCDKNNLQPGFWEIHNIKEIKVKILSVDGHEPGDNHFVTWELFKQ